MTSRRSSRSTARLLAARKLGWDTVPPFGWSHLTESQRMAFLIADNRLTENFSWDERMLGEQLKILSELELDFDLEAIGFEVREIDLLIDGPQHSGRGRS